MQAKQRTVGRDGAMVDAVIYRSMRPIIEKAEQIGI